MSLIARLAPFALALMVSSCSASELASVVKILTSDVSPSPGLPSPSTAGVPSPVSDPSARAVGPSFAPLRPLPSATNLPEFDVQIVVATAHEAALERATTEQLRREIDILNHYFVAEDGRPLIHFKLKGITTLADLRASECGYDAVLDAEDTWQNPFWDAYKACDDPRARFDPTAITFMVADHWLADGGFAYGDSLGGRTGGNFGRLPFVQIDWVRLDHRVQAPEEHEMGHAFGLPHVCEPGAAYNADTNIMSSHIDCEGSKGGQRTRGFTPDQVKIIMASAADYRERFDRNARLLAESASRSPVPSGVR